MRKECQKERRESKCCGQGRGRRDSSRCNRRNGNEGPGRGRCRRRD